MQGQYHVITLCGSTWFKNEIMEVQKRLTLKGNIVISVGLVDCQVELTLEGATFIGNRYKVI